MRWLAPSRLLLLVLALSVGCASDDDEKAAAAEAVQLARTSAEWVRKPPDAGVDAGLPTCCSIDPRPPTTCGCVRIGGRTPADGVCPERCGVNPGDGILVMSSGCFLNEIPSNSVCEAPDGG